MDDLEGSSDEENEDLKSLMSPFLLNLSQNTRFEISQDEITSTKLSTYLSSDLSLHFGDCDFFLSSDFSLLMSDFKNPLESYTGNPLAEVFIRQKEKREQVSVNFDDSVIDVDSLYHKFNLNGDEA